MNKNRSRVYTLNKWWGEASSSQESCTIRLREAMPIALMIDT